MKHIRMKRLIGVKKAGLSGCKRVTKTLSFSMPQLFKREKVINMRILKGKMEDGVAMKGRW